MLSSIRHAATAVLALVLGGMPWATLDLTEGPAIVVDVHGLRSDRGLMSVRIFVAAAAAVLGIALLVAPGPTSPARAQAWDEALAVDLSGSWSLAESEAAASAAIERGIAAAIEGLPPLVDALAARELRARLVVSPTITLSLAPDRIVARFAHATYDTVPGVPATVPVPNDPGTTMEVVQLLRDGHLEQVFTTDRGRRWSTFALGSGGELVLDVVVRSERLSSDVRFRIRYRRSG